MSFWEAFLNLEASGEISQSSAEFLGNMQEYYNSKKTAAQERESNKNAHREYVEFDVLSSKRPHADEDFTECDSEDHEDPMNSGSDGSDIWHVALKGVDGNLATETKKRNEQ